MDYHYFIGKLLYNGKEKYVNKSFRSLTQTQQYLMNVAGRNNKKVFPFINFGYIGQFNVSDEAELKDKLRGLLEGLGESIPKMRGFYKKYSLMKADDKDYIAIDYELDRDNIYGKIMTETIVYFLKQFRPIGSQSIKLVELNPGNEEIVLKKDEKDNNLLTKTRLPNPNYFTFDSIELIRTKDLDKLILESVDKVSFSKQMKTDKIIEQTAMIEESDKESDKDSDKESEKNGED